MKKISAVLVIVIFLTLIKLQVFAQISLSTENISMIKPYHLAVTYNKTTNLVFPYAIKSVDRGSKDILVQKAKDVENILQVKAGKRSFEETNLTVITAEGKLYSYIVNYTDNPTVLNFRFPIVGEDEKDAFFSGDQPNEAEMQSDAEKVRKADKNIRGIKDKQFGIKLQLDGLFIKGGVMYYRLRLQNRSNINYDIEQLRFFIRDQKKSKRTAAQELEVLPLYIQGDTSAVPGNSEHVFVYAVPKFTIPDQKYLTIQLMEKNGGRHLELEIPNKTVVKATLIK